MSSFFKRNINFYILEFPFIRVLFPEGRSSGFDGFDSRRYRRTFIAVDDDLDVLNLADTFGKVVRNRVENFIAFKGDSRRSF